MILQAIYLPKYAALDKTVWTARLAELREKHPVLIESLLQQVLWEAKEQPPSILHVSEAFVRAAEVKLPDHSPSDAVSVHSDDETIH
jgi:hypothetical protein